ncbi:TatD related DNase [Rhynchospora pubera]|uniref:TatD related DNase n=1 Tax=Rhynchospora pubera TaxID=906938 RepID=A0AAV8BTV5_9POAL|nr:TatD related DNase [Rhynchospora pubera]KAJ4799785.1 TatD related DNase [Rhynchospora pubera]
MSQVGGMRLFDAHCHLQDPRIAAVAPRLIRTAIDSGVVRFSVNGVSEKDWHVVKQMSDQYPSIIPSFGLHPWYVAERSPNWFDNLRGFFVDTPYAAVGEIGIDKGSHGKTIEYTEQVEVFQRQLELAKELQRPVSVHCVRAFGDLLEILKQMGPFPAGVILHSYMGSAEMVPELSELGSYFSFSGFLTSMKEQKAKKMLKSVPKDRILIETDAPDGLSNFNKESLIPVPREDIPDEEDKSASLNHPANIHNVLEYVSLLLEMPKEEVAEVSYQNAVRLFSYPGSKLQSEG